jgi:hypothetical protein
VSAGPEAASPADIIQFPGWISCRLDGEGSLGLILVGRTLDHPEEPVQLAFTGQHPSDIPEALDGATVTRLGPRRYQIASGTRSWTIEGVAHLHREVAGPFYQALPPRPVPWRKRLFWKVLLALAANPLGRRLLLR